MCPKIGKDFLPFLDTPHQWQGLWFRVSLITLHKGEIRQAAEDEKAWSKEK